MSKIKIKIHIGLLNKTDKMYRKFNSINNEVRRIQYNEAMEMAIKHVGWKLPQNATIQQVKESMEKDHELMEYFNKHKYIFDIIPKKSFMGDLSRIYIAFTDLEIIGYSIWEKHPNYNEYCMAQQLYVRQTYRRQGIGKELIKCNLKNIKGILACNVNDITRNMYNKYFKDITIFGNSQEDLWIPENKEMFFKQVEIWGSIQKNNNR